MKVDQYLKKIDNLATDGLSGVENSTAYRVDRITRIRGITNGKKESDKKQTGIG